MKFQHIKRTWTSPFYVYCKKHYCPDCNTLLSKTKVSKIVSSKSPEAKEHDFSSAGGDGYMIGDVKFIWTEFLCPNCGKQIPVKDMKMIERDNKGSWNIKIKKKKVESSDWRITSQEKYLFEATFEKKIYQKKSVAWDHDHCRFCWDKFHEDPRVGLTEGYYTESGESWVCEKCFADFKDQFKFKLK